MVLRVGIIPTKILCHNILGKVTYKFDNRKALPLISYKSLH